MAKPVTSPVENQQSNKASTPGVLPRPDFHFPGEVGRNDLDSDSAQFPKPVEAPVGAPNILLTLIDGAGFGQYRTFGSGISSPTIGPTCCRGAAIQPLSHHCLVQSHARCPHYWTQSLYLRDSKPTFVWKNREGNDRV